MTDTPVAVDFLVGTLQKVAPRPLRGGELAVLLNAAYPDFRAEALGFRNLRDFIRKRAPEVVEVGRSGMDFLYSLRTVQSKLGDGVPATSDSLVERALSQLMRDSRAWKTFTTPDSAFRLYLTDRGVVRSMHSNSRPLPEWREIERMSSEALRRIGEDFTADLDEIQKTVLVPTFQEPKWWLPFFDRLQSLGLKYKWIEFRRKRIQDEFRRRIEGMGTLSLPQPQESELALVPNTAEAAMQTQSELSIRKIAADVVQRMTESELRGLNLPLGYVVDSLTTR